MGPDRADAGQSGQRTRSVDAVRSVVDAVPIAVLVDVGRTEKQS